MEAEFESLKAWCRRLEDYITNHAETWGIPGPPGPASTVPGPKGDAGHSPSAKAVAAALIGDPAWVERVRGLQGPDGAKGKKGDKGDSPTAEEVAAALMAYQPWVDRLRGPQGLSGPRGERGTTGAGWPGAGQSY